MTCIVVSVITNAEKYNQISSLFIATPLIAFGFIGNLVNIVIWQKLIARAIKRNTTCGLYLKAIAFVDIGLLVSLLLTDSLTYIKPDIYRNYHYNWFYSYVGYPFFMFFTSLSFWLVASVDLCRLSIVLLPIKLRQEANYITKKAIITVTVFCFIVMLPDFFAFQPIKNVAGTPCLVASELYLSESFFNYRFWFQCILMMSIPWVIIIACNLIIVSKTIRSEKLKKMRSYEMGRLLFGVSVLFVTVISWQCVNQCLWMKNAHHTQTSSPFAFGKLGLVLNCSCKLPLYLTVSKTYRRTFIRTFKDPKRRYCKTYHPDMKFIKRHRKSIACIKRTSLNAVLPINTEFYGVYMLNSSENCTVLQKGFSPQFLSNFQASTVRSMNIHQSISMDID